jgi:hypothetical protein
VKVAQGLARFVTNLQHIPLGAQFFARGRAHNQLCHCSILLIGIGSDNSAIVPRAGKRNLYQLLKFVASLTGTRFAALGDNFSSAQPA